MPVRVLNGQWWRQCTPSYRLLDVEDPAGRDARYQQVGGTGVLYASSSERAAWCELLRHSTNPQISPFEIRRRVGRLKVTGLRVLDLTDPDVQASLGIDETDLIGDDYSRCQQLAIDAWAAGLDGLIAPAAGLPTATTLAIFALAATNPQVIAEHSRVQVPPITLLDLIRHIRPVGETASAIHGIYERLTNQGKNALQQRRR